MHVYVYQYVCIYLYVCLSVGLSVCLSVCLSILFVHPAYEFVVYSFACKLYTYCMCNVYVLWYCYVCIHYYVLVPYKNVAVERMHACIVQL